VGQGQEEREEDSEEICAEDEGCKVSQEETRGLIGSRWHLRLNYVVATAGTII
jgi:hypothetical protein